MKFVGSRMSNLRAAASNAEHDQRYKSDAREQHYERDEIIFEPMPITHDVHPCFKSTFVLNARLGGHPTSIFDADQKIVAFGHVSIVTAKGCSRRASQCFRLRASHERSMISSARLGRWCS